jgi:hypothetical protein
MSKNEKQTATHLGGSENDIVWGAAAIGQVIKRSPRQAVHLLENGRLPARKVGRLWAASRQRLLQHFAEVGL